MAAPKNWGFTRDQPIRDEILVSWLDGDLTRAVGRELEQRLLANESERRQAAGFARACNSTATATDGNARIQSPRQGLIDRCVSLGQDGVSSIDIDGKTPSSGARFEMPKLSFTTTAGAMVALAVTAILVRFMMERL